ncbi:MAG: AAA family ATPase [Succinivibrionaceae bacterium]
MFEENSIEDAVTIGEEDFKALRDRDLAYIDKTSFIQQFFVSSKENGQRIGSSRTSAKVTLITRPRRFGKTLTLSMLKYFLELNYQNPGDKSEAKKLFDGLAISDNQNETFCQRYMSEYPVILISLKGVGGTTFTDALSSLLSKVKELYSNFKFLLDSDALDDDEKEEFRFFCKFASISGSNLCKPEDEYKAKAIISESISNLTRLLNKAYSRKSIVLIDEYDVPLQKAQVKGYYDKMLDVIRGLFENALKTNSNLEKGIVTGCLRISKESIFTGLNNFVTRSITDSPLSDFIGFTRNEVHELLEKCNLDSYENEVAHWYDGYKFSDSEIFCPWSIINFCSDGIDHLVKNKKPILKNYWANSSGNDIIDVCIQRLNPRDLQRMQNLLDGKIEIIPDLEFTTYPDINQKVGFDLLLNMMLYTGYLTVDHVIEASDDDTNLLARKKFGVKIPNREIMQCFQMKVDYLFSSNNPVWVEKAQNLVDAFFANNPETVQNIINDMLSSFLSIRNTAQESYYHAFLSGVLAIVTGVEYKLESDTESGDGYADLQLVDENNFIAVIIECKKAEKAENPMLLSSKALEQIDNKHYAQSYEENGYVVYKYGIAFKGKSCRVATNNA